jgi:hypothetical protein
VCLEGHKKDCPHLLPDEEPQTAAEAVEAPRTVIQERHRFPSGEKLILAEASRLLNGRPVRVVLCAGAHKSGKTTFIALIGEMFRKGTFTEYEFAGSDTLCGFERASWRATIESGAESPDTERTFRVENDTFFHLLVRPSERTSGPLELLVSDLSGETYPEALASQPVCASQQALVRADHLVLFIDGKSIIDNAKRHAECDNAKTFLARVQSVMHRPKALHVQVAFSRWDYVLNHEKSADFEKICTDFESDLQRKFGDSFASLKIWKIAARPKKMDATVAEVQVLFGRWLESPTYIPVKTNHRNQTPKRDFSSYGIYG